MAEHNRRTVGGTFAGLATVGLAVVICIAAAPSADAAVTTLFTTEASDGKVFDFPLGGAFDGVEDSLIGIEAGISATQETRGIMEFVVSGIPLGATITGVELEVTSRGNANDAAFFLYSGNGAVDIADAIGGTSLGTFAVPLGESTFIQGFPLAISDFQTLFDAPATHFGLRFEVADNLTVNFASAEAPSDPVPMLRVSWLTTPTPIVPLPAAAWMGLPLLAGIGAMKLGRRSA